MSLSVNISLDVPPLSDTDVWWANAAAWSEYWRDINLQASFDSVTNTLYVPSAYNLALVSPVITADDNTQWSLATKQQMESLLLKVNTLDANYQTLRNELKAAGLLDNSQ